MERTTKTINFNKLEVLNKIVEANNWWINQKERCKENNKEVYPLINRPNDEGLKI